MRSLMSNPLLRLEYLSRFRRPMSAVVILLVAVIPILGVFTVISSTSSANNWGRETDFTLDLDFPMGLQSTGDVDLAGPGLLMGIVGAVTTLLLILVPAIAGGAIASERQNDTLQPLQITAMTPFAIVWGKLVGSLGYVLFLLLCLAPVLVVPYFSGGLPLSKLLVAYGVIAVIVIEVGAVSTFVSSRARRPLTAVVGSLIVTGALVAGPWIVAGLTALTRANSGVSNDDISTIAALSPVSLFGWLGDFGDVRLTEVWSNVDNLIASGFAIAITVIAVFGSLHGVTAPVERDR